MGKWIFLIVVCVYLAVCIVAIIKPTKKDFD